MLGFVGDLLETVAEEAVHRTGDHVFWSVVVQAVVEVVSRPPCGRLLVVVGGAVECTAEYERDDSVGLGSEPHLTNTERPPWSQVPIILSVHAETLRKVSSHKL